MTGYTSLNARLAKVIINANCVVIKHRCATVVVVVVVVVAAAAAFPALPASINRRIRVDRCDSFRFLRALLLAPRANPGIDI